MYAFVLTTFNDADNAIKAYKSLLDTIPLDSTYKIVVVDAGSRPEERQKLEANFGTVIGPYEHLSDALNAGIYNALGYSHDNIQEFVKTGNTGCDHVFWIHTDMLFFQWDWARKLINIYEHLWPLVGRLAPGTSNIDNTYAQLNQGIGIGHSNNCPWVIGKDYIRNTVAKYGHVYNPAFTKIGGAEDHDTWFRILDDGMFVCVTYLVDVVHKGMGNRGTRDTMQEQIHNREVFHRIWGQNIFPKIDFDLKDVNTELMEKFGYLKDEVLSLNEIKDKLAKEL